MQLMKFIPSFKQAACTDGSLIKHHYGSFVDTNLFFYLLLSSVIKVKHYEDFETRVETLRPYFKSIGINLAPKYIYCGNTFKGAENMTEAVRKEKGRFLWSRNPYYELELLDY